VERQRGTAGGGRSATAIAIANYNKRELHPQRKSPQSVALTTQATLQSTVLWRNVGVVRFHTTILGRNLSGVGFFFVGLAYQGKDIAFRFIIEY